MPEEESHDANCMRRWIVVSIGRLALSVVVSLRDARGLVEGRTSCHLRSGWSED